MNIFCKIFHSGRVHLSFRINLINLNISTHLSDSIHSAHTIIRYKAQRVYRAGLLKASYNRVLNKCNVLNDRKYGKFKCFLNFSELVIGSNS